MKAEAKKHSFWDRFWSKNSVWKPGKARASQYSFPKSVHQPLALRMVEKCDVKANYQALILLKKASGQKEGEFDAYFIDSECKKKSIKLWVEQMGILPLKALERKDHVNLFNEDFYKLKTFIKEEGALPSIIHKSKYPDLKLLPLEILTLEKQKNVTILGGSLLGLPTGICKMTWLEELVLFETKIRILPENMGDLVHMKRLYVQKSLLCEVPTSLLTLNQFECICFDGNPLSKIAKQDLQYLKTQVKSGEVSF